MSKPVLRKPVTVTGVDNVKHISCVTSVHVWISGKDKLILTNIAGDTLCCLDAHTNDFCGAHTVNITGDLTYIDSDKLSKGNASESVLIKNTGQWVPWCVYCSPSNGDLLVGTMYRRDEDTGKIQRYNNTGQIIQTIQHDNNTGQGLYREPIYITENLNGDVIVCDYFRGVVVTERGGGGRHCFTYTGTIKGPRVSPFEICTDMLSHILVCEVIGVQMLDNDGNFLMWLLKRQQGVNWPCGIHFNNKTNLLWVG
ncbi:uncharacterized protein LOC133180680 [Saccostrea echinata]|uniref:uncharacterized protein LOC133180680 n=1 Tax=Saccostrea echinata TaxID=191078 RepID=UPI002A831245|nr:uncharacterized protein LOC133180680 [Saccostrea echinata]